MPFDEKYKLAWISLKKDDICSENEDFFEDVFKKQIDTLLGIERYNINKDKFPGVTGDTYEDYKKYMLGDSEKEYIITKDELYISYIHENYFSIVGYTD